MPEGPELRKSSDWLNRHVAGFQMKPTGHGGRYAAKPPEGYDSIRAATPLEIKGVFCKGKFQYWALADDWFMWVTYGMSGQWSTERGEKHKALELTLTKGDARQHLYFVDPRHFGTIKFVKGTDKTEKKLNSIGPDMLAEPSASAFLDRLLLKPERTIAEALMDQSCVSGVGNYVKAESLYLAKLSPWRKVIDLSDAEVQLLRNSIITVMQTSLNNGGATFSTYRNPNGDEGDAARRFVVYGHKTDPDGREVKSEETPDGRTSWWVPEVQK